MIYILPESIVLLSSFAVALAFVYFKVPNGNIQEILIILAVLLILFFNKFTLAHHKSLGRKLILLLLFLTALSLELIIFSSGGFYSPFLILIHLFALAISFMINLRLALLFFLFAVPSLFLHLVLNKNLYAIFLPSPGPVFLYTLSFFVIAPVIHFVSKHYHLKNQLVKVLTGQVAKTRLHHKTLMEGVSDLIFITDTNLKILTLNEAAEKAFGLNAPEQINRPLNTILHFQDLEKIRDIIENKTPGTIKDLQILSKKVTLQIKPITDPGNSVNEIMFIISYIHN